MEKSKKVEKVFEYVKDSLKKFYENDKILIEKGVCERSCVFRIGIYLNEIISVDNELKEINVDSEYNRNCNDIKKILMENNDGNRIFPDLLIHERGNHNQNLVVIEFKKENNSNNDNDIKKLIEFTNLQGSYKYELGLFIKLYDSYDKTIENIKKFSNGKEN